MTVNPYLSVQALTKYVKRKFDADPHLRNVYVKGELSNVTNHPSGHIYFTLKDERSRIRAAMFRSSASKLKFKAENGMNVLITGDVSVYEASGQYQLYAQSMEPDGVGALYLAFEQLKEKLDKEGLFNEQWKSSLPLFPERVGVVTAQTGAAIQDICSTIARRYPLAEIKLFPATVQGSGAAPTIIRAIEQANRLEAVDVLIVGRGGGSIEDLWAFNEEDVARAIFSSRIPIISAVGHETDTTIADFVADKRAPTPTAAAELAVPAREELVEKVMGRQQQLYRSLASQIKNERKRLSSLASAYPLQFPERLYRPFTEKLSGLEMRLLKSGQDISKRDELKLVRLKSLLRSYAPTQQVTAHTKEVKVLTDRLTKTIRYDLRVKTDRFSTTIRMLQALNPLSVMDRGYSIVYQEDNVIKSAKSLQVEHDIQIQLQDGTVDATVRAVHLSEKGEA